MSTAVTYALESRLEIFASQDIDPFRNDRYRVARIVSYDDGSTWINNWIENKVGVFSSSLAGAITGDSLDTYLVGRGQDDRMWLGRLAEYYAFESAGWQPIGAGKFKGRPAIVLNGTSQTRWERKDTQVTSYGDIGLRVFGLGLDDRIWWAFSTNGADSWDMAWRAIPDGKFKNSPAAVTSADGKFLALFGRGLDDRIWWIYSTTSGGSWDIGWTPIGDGVFTSAPAAACSADGKSIYVVGRGKDDRYWYAYARNGAAKWDMAWSPIGEGVFVGAPSMACSWNGEHVHVFGKGKDDRIWQARSRDGGKGWDIAWRKIADRRFVDVDI